MYNAMYFLKKFDAIPEHRWITGHFGDGFGNHCVLGHCGIGISNDETNMASKLAVLFRQNLDLNAIGVNDAKKGAYVSHEDVRNIKLLGKGPKERIINALLLINAGVKL